MNCPNCNEPLLPNTNFCPKCGYEIARGVSVGKQLYIYFVSLLLPPFGLIWTFKFLKNTTEQKKRIAIIAAVLTGISIILTIWFTLGFLQGIQQQINTYQNLGI